MIKNITCIECPNGCTLSVTVEGGKALKVEGNKCPKGEKYGVSEIENPVRILTSSVLTEGMPLKMISVKTDAPIPKKDLFRAMAEVKKVRLKHPLHAGDIIVKNFLGMDVNLVATRQLG